MAEDEEPTESRFNVCLLNLGGFQLTVIGPLAGIEVVTSAKGRASASPTRLLLEST